MRLSDESKAFHHAVYSQVYRIPYGHVTTYGHIAFLIGRPNNSRQVGSALKNMGVILPYLVSESENVPYCRGTLPWWRVVSSAGKILRRENSVAEVDQANLLVEEGVLSGIDTTLTIDLEQFGWFAEDD